MPWTNKQKSLAAQACRAAGISEDQRTDVILRNFPHAHSRGDITSTSPRLTSGDFAGFMGIVERFAGGKVLHFTAGYWRRASADQLQRMRYRVNRIAAALEAAGRLQPNGVGLAGWIEKRVSGGVTDRIDDLEFPAMQALLMGLQAYAKQCGVELSPRDSAAPSGLGAAPFASVGRANPNMAPTEVFDVEGSGRSAIAAHGASAIAGSVL
ncbi:MAG TPA: hypothetical protein VHX86_17160 [Tepidisphaeraceae bacterium]|jgi:hypothetical protein|nr:hypothetical protein [Tepidisphaeraceae bacterium]